MINFLKKNLFLTLFISACAFLSFAVLNGANAMDSVSSNAINTSAGMEAILCNILAFVSGGVGKTFASFAVIAVGVAFVGGKVTWATMITFALGIAAIFGAPMVVKVLSGSSKAACSGFSGISLN